MTTYVHPLDGPQSIADWFAGSTLQPFLERLADHERCEFLARYRAGLKDAYPAPARRPHPVRLPAPVHRRGQGRDGVSARGTSGCARTRSRILRG